MTFSIKQLQEEQQPWTKHNFGDRPDWMPLFGVIEEIGEICEAVCIDEKEDEKLEALLDGIADCVVFMSDFCIASGFDFEAITKMEAQIDPKFFGSGDRILTIYAGRLAHSYLKKAQGIRGTPEEHDADMKLNLAQIFRFLRAACEARVVDIVQLTGKVWANVKQRDFKKFPKNGLTQ